MTTPTTHQIHDVASTLRLLRAKHNEQRAAELINAFAAHGVHVEASDLYGGTCLSIRFDEVERLLHRLSGGQHISDGITRSPVSAYDSPEVPDDFRMPNDPSTFPRKR